MSKDTVIPFTNPDAFRHNVLDKLPKSLQAEATSALQEVWMSPTKVTAHQAFDQFIERYQAKFDQITYVL